MPSALNLGLRTQALGNDAVQPPPQMVSASGFSWQIALTRLAARSASTTFADVVPLRRIVKPDLLIEVLRPVLPAPQDCSEDAPS